MVERWGPRVVHIFSEQGDHLNKFCLQRSVFSPKIVFHRESQQVALVDTDNILGKLYIEIYTKDGEFVRSISIHKVKSFSSLQGIAVTTEGCIAVVTRYPNKVSSFKKRTDFPFLLSSLVYQLIIMNDKLVLCINNHVINIIGTMPLFFTWHEET